MKPPPVHVVALFFEDIRAEVGNKYSFMGQLLGTAHLAAIDPPQPMDRLAILLHARWPKSFQPKSLQLKIAVSGNTVIEQRIESPPPQAAGVGMDSPFAGQAIQAAMTLRGHPINAGDEVQVWLRVDDSDIPAGRLRLEQAPETGSTPA